MLLRWQTAWLLARWCWLLVGGLGAFSHGILPGMLECLHDMAAGFSQSDLRERGKERIWENARYKLYPFYALASVVMYLHFCHILFVQNVINSQPTFKERAVNFHLFKGEVSICRHIFNSPVPKARWSRTFQVIVMTSILSSVLCYNPFHDPETSIKVW